MGTLLHENRATVVCALVVAALLAVLWLTLGARPQEGDDLVALVHDADGQVHELPLDEDASLTVVTSLGANEIAVEDGAVRMVDADCPNRTCLLAEPIAAPGKQIICLPHQLWIEVVPAGSTGGELDVTLAEDIDADVDLVAR